MGLYVHVKQCPWFNSIVTKYFKSVLECFKILTKNSVFSVTFFKLIPKSSSTFPNKSQKNLKIHRIVPKFLPRLYLLLYHISIRGGSRTAATSKMVRFVIEAVNYYPKAPHFGCCSSPRSASVHDPTRQFDNLTTECLLVLTLSESVRELLYLPASLP